MESTNANKERHVAEMRARIEARLAERVANVPNKPKKMTLKQRREIEKKKKAATAKNKKLMSKPLAGSIMNQAANGKMSVANLRKLKSKMRSAQNKRASIIASKYA